MWGFSFWRRAGRAAKSAASTPVHKPVDNQSQTRKGSGRAALTYIVGGVGLFAVVTMWHHQANKPLPGDDKPWEQYNKCMYQVYLHHTDPTPCYKLAYKW